MIFAPTQCLGPAVVLLMAALACSGEGPRSSITSEDLFKHIRRLSADEFEGRAPGTKGETLTVSYLTEQFKAFGLRSAHPDGSYIQNVPLVGLTAKSSLKIVAGEKTFDLRFPSEYVAVTRRIVPELVVEVSDIVFVGYGVVAPDTDGMTTKAQMCAARRS